MNFPLIWQEWLIASSVAALVTLLISLFKRSSLSQAAGWTSFMVYLTTLACLTVLPFPQKTERFSLSALWDAVDRVPLRSLQKSWNIVQIYLARGDQSPLHTFLWNNVGNLLVLIPLALFFYYFFRLGFIRSFLASLGASLLIELLQALFCWYFGVMYRVIDINDIILNGTGALLSLGLASLLQYLIGKKISKKHKKRRNGQKGTLRQEK